MNARHLHPTTVVSRHPVHSTLAAFPVAGFTLALFTDIAYWRTGELMWKHFSEWLLFAGLVFGALAAVAAIVDFALRPHFRDGWPVWPYVLGGLVVLALAFVNSFVHSVDSWTGVVPYGLVLSALTVIVMLVTGWFSRPVVVVRETGVYP